MASNYEAMTVKELKEEVAQRDGLNLKSNLRKAEIIEKLREWDDEQGAKPGSEIVEVSAVSRDHEMAEEGTVQQSMPQKEEATNGTSANATAELNGEDKAVDSAASDSPDTIQANSADVSALEDPAKEPTPPPHHPPIQPVEQSDEALVLPAAEADEIQSRKISLDEPQAEILETKQPTQADIKPPISDVLQEDLAEDSRKRKRRSLTPAVVEEEVEAKRARHDAEGDTDVAIVDESAKEMADFAQLNEPVFEGMEHTSTDNVNRISDQYKLRSASPDVDPSLHLATRALYIGNLKRPLQQQALSDHLDHIAIPAGRKDAASSNVELIYLDQIKTHALVLMSSLSAASRARARLHNQKYPDEASREPLFVDFVPEDKVAEWIEKEKNAGGGRRSSVRFSVTYTPSGEAVHGEAKSSVSNAPPGAPRGPRAPSFADASPWAGPPRPPQSALGPRGQGPRLTGPNSAPLPPRQRDTYSTLDDRSSSLTSTRPSIPYNKVDPRIAAARIEELRAQTSRKWDPNRRRLDEQMWRYSFEHDDRLVQTGVSRGQQQRERAEYKLEQEYRARMHRGNGDAYAPGRAR